MRQRFVTYTLIKLSVSAAADGWVVTTVDLADVVTLDLGDLVHGDVAREGDGEVVAEGEDLAALVLEVVYEFGVLAVLSGEHLLQLEDRRVYRLGAVALEHFDHLKRKGRKNKISILILRTFIFYDIYEQGTSLFPLRFPD